MEETKGTEPETKTESVRVQKNEPNPYSSGWMYTSTLLANFQNRSKFNLILIYLENTYIQNGLVGVCSSSTFFLSSEFLSSQMRSKGLLEAAFFEVAGVWLRCRKT